MNKFKTLLLGLLLGAIIAGTTIFLLLNRKIKSQSELEHLQEVQQQDQFEATTKNGYDQLVANMLNLLDDELKVNPARSLSDETIDRIIALCYYLKPYAKAKQYSSSSKLLSPERGQLLLVLISMRLDTVSMNKIRSSGSFVGADLHKASLMGADLHSLDLKGADLSEANLENANLQNAVLIGANLWGANLNDANLDSAQLKSADMRWAELNGASLIKADLQEVDLISAQLRKCDLRGANLRWTDLSDAFLIEAELDSVDMFRAVLKRAQLTKADMPGVNLNNAILSEANLTEVNLTGANLLDVVLSDLYWTDRLEDWKVIGRQEIKAKYSVVEGVSYEKSKYKLVLIGR